MNSTPGRQTIGTIAIRPRPNGHTLLQHTPLIAWTAVLPNQAFDRRQPATLRPEVDHAAKTSDTARVYATWAKHAAHWPPKALAQDRAFACTDPDLYARIAKHLITQYPYPDRLLRNAIPWLTHKLAAAGISALLTARLSHAFGAYTKMRAKGLQLGELHDLLGIRIITEHTGDCYRAMETVYSLWDPVRGDFDDYIRRPKLNGYQSLHTTLKLSGRPALEIQIRTWAMHIRAEQGPAAHWRYKAQTNLP